MNKRIFQYDLMRFSFMLMVLAVHVVSAVGVYATPYNTTWTVSTILKNFFMVANPLFFMLSGKFSLGKSFENKNDYAKYYKNKLITIIVPFIIISFIVYLPKFIGEYSLLAFIKKLITGKIQGTFWFVYTILGIFIISPFYSKMIQNMNHFEKKLMLIVLFVANMYITTLRAVGIKGGLELAHVSMASWHFYYIAGYLIEEIFATKKSRNILCFTAVSGFVVHFLLQVFFNGTQYRLYDPCALLTIESFGVYFFLLDHFKIKNERISKIISFVSSYSFIFYLLHMDVLYKILPFFNLQQSSLHNICYAILIYGIVFAVTFLLSFVIKKLLLDTLCKWLKRLFSC